jgi:hypothetical protein
MKDIYKNPNLYYILVPVVIALWPLIAGGIYLPKTERIRNKEMQDYKEGRKHIDEILLLDSARLDYSDPKGKPVEFKYYDAVGKVADSCKIANRKVQSKPIVEPREGRKTQDCHVTLEDVNIATFAKFLSQMQIRWAKLQCVNTILTKKKGAPDKWKVDLDFKYSF